MKIILKFLSKFDGKTLLLSGIILFLFIALMMQRCSEPPIVPTPKTDTVIQIVNHYIHDTIEGKPKIIHEKGDTIWQTLPNYIPDSTYLGLLKQYNSLGDKFFKQNTYATSFKIDSIGWCYVYDTVSRNSLTGSTLVTDFKIPTIIKTITKTAPPKRQLYIGGGIKGSSSSLINGIEGGILYKDKKDRIFGANIGYINNIGIECGIQSYWKINLKK